MIAKTLNAALIGLNMFVLTGAVLFLCLLFAVCTVPGAIVGGEVELFGTAVLLAALSTCGIVLAIARAE